MCLLWSDEGLTKPRDYSRLRDFQTYLAASHMHQLGFFFGTQRSTMSLLETLQLLQPDIVLFLVPDKSRELAHGGQQCGTAFDFIITIAVWSGVVRWVEPPLEGGRCLPSSCVRNSMLWLGCDTNMDLKTCLSFCLLPPPSFLISSSFSLYLSLLSPAHSFCFSPFIFSIHDLDWPCQVVVSKSTVLAGKCAPSYVTSSWHRILTENMFFDLTIW